MAVVPGLLLLIARDLLLHDPPRVLAWRLLHDVRLAQVPGWLAPLLPRPDAGLDRDPIALLLGGLAVGLAAAYALAVLFGLRPAVRAALIALATLLLVVAPTVAFVAMGTATQRPYGQDGGVVQLPLALDKILAGQSPYGADYSDSILGKEARASDFWAPYGGNPILRHHAYLPGTHLLTLPFHLLGRFLGGAGDPRLITLLAYLAAAWLAALLVEGPALRLCAAAVTALNPLVYWHQVFGANDILVVALLLLAVWLAGRQSRLASAAVLGLACATKHFAWPFAPFLLAQLAGWRGPGEALHRDGWRRLWRPAAVAAVVFTAVVAPLAALDPGRFWADVVVYNAGLPGADKYPLGGTPGFGFANLVIYFGGVSSLRDDVPLGLFYLLLVPLGLLLLRWQVRRGGQGAVLIAGSAALLASLYVSRVVHPNYLVVPAILLPVGLLMERRGADLGVVPLLLLGFAVEVAESEAFRTTWHEALAVRLPQQLPGLAALLAPRAGPGLTEDPLGLALSAAAAGLALAYLLVGLLRPAPRWRLALAVAAMLITVLLPARMLVSVGGLSGVVRGQDPWLATTLAGAGSPLPVREAWAASFRRDPPALLEPAAPTPGDAVLARVLGGVGLRDPRPWLVAALCLAGLLLARRLSGEDRLLGLGLVLLTPALAVATVFGSPEALVLAALLAGWMLRRGGWPLLSGVVLGACVSQAPLALLATPFLLLGSADRRGRALLGLGSGLAAVLGLALALGWRPEAALAAIGPGAGFFNLFLFRGVAEPDSVRALAFALPLLAVAAAWLLALRGRWDVSQALAWSGAFLLVGVWVAPSASAHALGTPGALLALSLLMERGRAGDDLDGPEQGIQNDVLTLRYRRC